MEVFMMQIALTKKLADAMGIKQVGAQQLRLEELV